MYKTRHHILVIFRENDFNVSIYDLKMNLKLLDYYIQSGQMMSIIDIKRANVYTT